MTERVRRPVLGDRAALPYSALRGDDERVPRRIVSLVFDQDLDEAIQVERRFGYEAARRGHVGRVQCAEPGVASEDAEDADALVRAERRALPVDELLGARDRSGEADAVL